MAKKEIVTQMSKSRQAANQRSNAMNPNHPSYRHSANNRSNTFNPTSPAHQSAQNNRSNQHNPNHSKGKG
jgi:hypothetical protein